MTIIKEKIDRRTFIKSSLLAGGGLMLSFSWLASGQPVSEEAVIVVDELASLNGYIKIDTKGIITIMSPNPEGGQNVKTSMPMIVAEELDADWNNVIVEQASLNSKLYNSQTIGGSNAIRTSWRTLRTAGATGRLMLVEAAAKTWGVSASEITTEAGVLYHKNSGKKAGYGEMATAAAEIKVPNDVPLKNVKDFKIIGTAIKNVDGKKIVTGQPLFGIDVHREGMLIAMIVHPPAFGLKLKSFDDTEVRKMPGVKDVFAITTTGGYTPQMFTTVTFPNQVAVVGTSTWEVMNAKKALKVEWEPDTRVENTTTHYAQMTEMGSKPGNVRRRDGDPETAFKNADRIIERTYTGPFLAHNCMEPMNFFANVTEEGVEAIGPLQKPATTEAALAARLGISVDKIDIQFTRLGGGFGRRSYAHWLIEAALISQKMNAPVKLIYSREDDMTSGIYRSTYQAKYRAALDANNNLIAFYVNAGGVPESPLAADRFPAGAVDNYLAEDWSVDSNITIGSFRAPRSNFMGAVEQSFLDEVAEAAGKDPIEFRLELLNRAKTKPVGSRNDYDPARYAGVLELVKEKSKWGTLQNGVHRGVAAYFCHASYAAQVVDMVMENDKPVIKKVYAAIDCGTVVNPLAATNMIEGATVDGIGNALYGEMTFKDGVPAKNNFNTYRMIRHAEAPKEIEVHFVKNDIAPTGLGEPAFPPIFAAVANALYKTTGTRYYKQPFLTSEQPKPEADLHNRF